MGVDLIAVTPQVDLVEHDPDPLRKLYRAYRTCYSWETPQELHGEDETDEVILKFVSRQLQTEHTSPLEHVQYTFAIAGVSRTFSHQFVRHRIGISFSQQSGRYADLTMLDRFNYVLPPSVKDVSQRERFEESVRAAVESYLLLKHQIEREDARMLLPSCQATNFMVTINLAALLHMADIRLCTLAQWEFRRVVALMRAEVKRVHPEIARWIAPKCAAVRRGVCDEHKGDWEECALGGSNGLVIRPHVSMVREIGLRDISALLDSNTAVYQDG